MAFLIDQLNNSGLFAQSAYSASISTCDSDGNVITATYLSSVDLTPYQTTAGMTAYATTGDVANKLDTTAFSDVSGTFLTAHQSLDGYATTAWVDSQGYLTAHQPISADEWNNVYDTVNVYSGSWTGSESSPTASVDSNGSIDIVSSNNTVYFDVNGTWFNNAVNSALPTSAVQWNSNYNTVNTNSGVWGGSALNISAGDGVKVTLVNNNLVFSTDETVIWSGDATTTETAINLSEPLTAFNKVEIWNKSGQIYTIGTSWSGAYIVNTCQCEYNRLDLLSMSGYKQVLVNLSANPSNWTNIVYLGNKICASLRYATTANNFGITYYANVGDVETHIGKIVGINRKNNA